VCERERERERERAREREREITLAVYKGSAIFYAVHIVLA
jgi:hypothetical protein